VSTSTLRLVREGLTTPELLKAISLPKGRLDHWQKHAGVRPWRPGKTKRPSLWGARQCLALAVITALSESSRHKGVTMPFIRRTMNYFARMTDGQLLAWLSESQGECNAHTQEEFATLDWAGFDLKRGQAPGDKEIVADQKRRLARVEALLLGRDMPSLRPVSPRWPEQGNERLR
jgi:hypothetical protein